MKMMFYTMMQVLVKMQVLNRSIKRAACAAAVRADLRHVGRRPERPERTNARIRENGSLRHHRCHLWGRCRDLDLARQPTHRDESSLPTPAAALGASA